MQKKTGKMSLDFASFGCSFALAVADEIKRLVPMKSHQYNRALAVEVAVNRLLDSVAPHGPKHIDSKKAAQLFDKLQAEVVKMYAPPKKAASVKSTRTKKTEVVV